jgi:hypothetical protein
MKIVPQRNGQFENIRALVAEFRAHGYPIISFDTKKKENLYHLNKSWEEQ